MPTFNGQNIFGTAVRVRRNAAERAIQQNSYGGLSGVEALDMGSRGRVTTVTGRFICQDAATLNSAILLFESYVDGNSYDFVDQFGNVWPSVMLVEFNLTGELNQVFSTGAFTVQYSSRFQHLI
jgi:hypothetical protein